MTSRVILTVLLLCVYLTTLVLTIENLIAYPLVSTPSGDLIGSFLTSRLGKTIFSFRGIKYAKAPVGELRFKPPVPIGNWNGTYNATTDGPVCPQPTTDPTSEDCLFLNVYTTKLNNNSTRPVIVFFHPGGYYSGSSRSNWVGPEYFMDQDIVLVTANNRLATLGFLSLGNKEAPGNYALKDQVVVLKWIKTNIHAFGGDPDSVTILGYSAGAASGILHMMSPMSQGLFHKVIAMSASPFVTTPPGNNQTYLAKKQARLVGCPDDPISSMFQCLKTVSAQKLGNSLYGFTEFGNDPILLWSPVIEKDFGQERFITDNPIKLVTSGRFMKVPIITGVSEHEFGYRAFDVLANETLTSEMNSKFDEVAPIAFCYERHTEFSKNVSNNLRKFYFGDNEIDKSQANQLSDLYADSITGFSVNRAAKLISQYSDQPVYYYRFSYKGTYSTFQVDPNYIKNYGPVHHDELIYLFYIKIIFPPFGNTSSPDTKMVSELTSMWVNFAKHGKPIPENKACDGVIWKPFNNNDQGYMDIGSNLTMKQYLYKDRYLKWEKLFPLSNYGV